MCILKSPGGMCGVGVAVSEDKVEWGGMEVSGVGWR